MRHNKSRSAVEIIQKQLVKIPDILEFLIADMNEEEWTTRIAEGENMIGFLAWHIPSVQDFVVQSFIRRQTGVRHQSAWRLNTALDTDTFPYGISLTEADQTAINSKPDVVINYAYAVMDEIVAWLSSIDDDVLSNTVDSVEPLKQLPAYQAFQFPDATTSILNRSVDDLLLSTCYGHLRSHFGEIETVKSQLRATGANL